MNVMSRASDLLTWDLDEENKGDSNDPKARASASRQSHDSGRASVRATASNVLRGQSEARDANRWAA